MARTIGSKNQQTATLPTTCNLEVQQRLELLAKIIVDRLMENDSDTKLLISEIETQVYGKSI